MILGMVIGAGALSLPRSASKVMGPAAWWLMAVIGVVYIIIAAVNASVARVYPDETFPELVVKFFGRPVGFAAGLLLSVFFLLVIPAESKVMMELVNIALLPLAPPWFIVGSFLLVCLYMAFRGMDTVAQVNQILIGISFTVLIITIVLAWQFFQPDRLLPILDIHNVKIFSAEWLNIAFTFLGFQIILLIAPYLREPRKLFRDTVTSMAAVTVRSVNWPILELAKAINISGIFIERLDLLLVIAWIPAIFTTAAGGYYFCALSLGHLFSMERLHPILWLLFPATVFLTYIVDNVFTLQSWIAAASLLGMVSTMLLPVGHLIYLAKRKISET